MSINNGKFILLFAIGLYCQWASAQQPLLRHFLYQTWGMESGLPQTSVTALQRDSQGMMWIGTENGLVRFDGNEMTIFQSENTPAIRGNWIKHILLDQKGNLWITTIRNLLRYRNGQFENISESESIGNITNIVEDAKGRIWIAADRLWQLKEGKLVASEFWSDPVFAMAVEGNTLWLADNRGNILHWNIDNAQKIQNLESPVESVITKMVWSDGRLWLATSSGLWNTNTETSQIIPVVIPNKKGLNDKTNLAVSALSASVDGGVWMANEHALYQFKQGKVVAQLDAKEVSAFPTIICIYLDDSGSFWLGSLTSGLRYYWPSPVTQFTKTDGLSNVITWAYWRDEEGLLVGSDDGVFRKNVNGFETFITGEKVPGGTAYTLFKDYLHRLWIGTRIGLARKDPDGKITQFENLRGLQVNALLETKRQELFVATSRGLWEWQNDRLTLIFDVGEIPVRYLFEDSSQTLWIGTESGLWKRTGKHFGMVQEKLLKDVFVTSITESDDGQLFIGSYQDGLFVGQNNSWRQLTRTDGLPALGVFFLGFYKDWLWVTYGDGVYRIGRDSLQPSKSLLQIEMILHDTGNQSGRARVRCCNGGGNAKGVFDNNLLWAPTLGGAVSIDLNIVPKNPPRVSILDVRQQNRSLPMADSLTLSASSRDIEFHYNTMDFSKAKALRYRYRLLAYSDNWINAGNRRVAYYTNLPQGQLQFEVQSRYEFEAWGPSATIQIMVPTPFVESLSFRVILFAGFLLLFWLILWLRTLHLQNRSKELQNEVQAATRDLQSANQKLIELNETLHQASVTDSLTGLHNRRFIEEQMPSLLSRLKRLRRDSNLVLGFFLIDLDLFKRINDKFGHDVGDTVLKSAADAFNAVIREEDYLLRWGGEEFLLLVPEQSPDELYVIAERLRQATLRTSDSLAIEEQITASVGYVGHPLAIPGQSPDDWQSTLAVADFALYAAKGDGRNCVATVQFENNISMPQSAGVSGQMLSYWKNMGQLKTLIQRTENSKIF